MNEDKTTVDLSTKTYKDNIASILDLEKWKSDNSQQILSASEVQKILQQSYCGLTTRQLSAHIASPSMSSTCHYPPIRDIDEQCIGHCIICGHTLYNPNMIGICDECRNALMTLKRVVGTGEGQ